MPKTRLVEFMAAGCLALALGVPAIGFAAPPSSLEAPLLVQNETNQQSQQSQKKIDAIASKTNDALQTYLTTMQQIDRLKAYNSQISKLIQSQQQQMAQIQRQMSQIGDTQKQVMPLMQQMIDALRNFIKLDLPFQVQDRLARVQQLEDLMSDASVTDAERFRQIMDAYMAEVDYGRNIGSYRGPLAAGGKTRTVDFLRIGRIALMYQTIDGSETGFWNRLTQQWQIDNDLSDAVAKGLDVATS
ncbi:MAG TPA: DUF3450 domain-containing protein, partial [Gammaproteobacteria bacterium]|nr:DUF3450 domain-containing protein [Gammaproteobacteria bacterium]